MEIRHRWWFALLMVLLLGPVLLYGGIISPLGMALVRSIVQSQINRRIDGTLSIGCIRSNLFSWISAEQIRLKSDGTTTPVENASLRLIEARYNPIQLLQGNGSSLEINIERPLLRLRVEGTGPHSDTVATAATDHASPRIPIPGRVRITDGTLQYIGEAQDLSITLKDIDLNGASPPASGQATGSLRIGEARVRAGTLRDTSITVQATFQIAIAEQPKESLSPDSTSIGRVERENSAPPSPPIFRELDALCVSLLSLRASHTSLRGYGEIRFYPEPTLHLAIQSETDLAAAF